MTQTVQNLEIEVKFHIPDPEGAKQRLKQLGAVGQPKVFETNVRLEDSARSLKTGNRLLRLRQDSRCRLTYKSALKKQDTQFKIYEELEVEISDFDTMNAILNALGYQGVQIYEKQRQTFRLQNVLICMDSMPYGDFLEIEGPEDGIREAAHALGLQWNKRILTNYLAIFETLRQKYSLPFKDVTFDNFNQHPVDVGPYLLLFEAGDDP